ncbi:MAG: cobyrinate a,c-diamide synthase, partial [Cyanobacteria bacterium J06629_19]
MSIILAGDRSGTGKTTITLALLSALKKRGHTIQSFKVGPDYIDPMFHSAVTNRACYNLDPVLTSEVYVQQSFHSHSVDADQAIVEGVMGLFDGATGTDDTASTAHIARLLELPVVLAVDCGRMARSLAALVQGYRHFDARVKVAGVILNRVGSDRHLQLLSDALAAINMPIFGVFRKEKAIQLPSRHLGLVPTGEISEFAQIAERLAGIGDRSFDWEQLEPW